jgi:IS5 family transposase
MDHSFLAKCLHAIRPATWRRINEILGRQAADGEKIDVGTIRADTTAVETNIHWPTDASLLWDTWRVASRLLRRGRDLVAHSCLHRFHDKKIKGMYLFIVRYIKSKSKARQRKVRSAFRKLIVKVEWIVEVAQTFCQMAGVWRNLDLDAVALELKQFLPSMKKVVSQARRAQVDGEKVPARERVFSIFQPHTELIKRGRAQKPVEFGHMVLLCQTREKFITDYQVYEHRKADCELTEEVIARHEKLFDNRPEVVAADKGFCPDADKYAELEEQVDTLAIPKRMQDLADKAMKMWQAFRAGIEGTISSLKRAFRLARCFYHGFKRFDAAVGLGVFAHNLLVLARKA